MRFKTFFLFLSLASVMIGCGENTNAGDKNFETVETGTFSGIIVSAPTVYKITNGTEWQDFWNQHKSNMVPVPALPEVDFSKEMIIALIDSQKPSGGYAVTITDIAELNGALQVSAVRKEPGAGCFTIAAITTPFHIVRLLRSDLEPVLKLTTEVIDCK